MADKEVVLTLEGLKKIEDELEHLKTVKRKEVAERIKHALAFGDISENSEYDEAKNEQAQLEERIAKLEGILRTARVIDDEDINLETVSIGTKVKVKDLEFDEEIEYTIVGSAEADPYEGKISNESPVGEALIGRKKGEIVEVQVPDGVIKYEVLEITR
ncbi:transcription elongation factor GreA [Caloranaerobacter azorensis]|uniref:Transcription elongation factor GreA n=3 Tax=Caloranaerobacter azorensis TaxID=116090 RepID=A0A1M5SUU8_9FIRM|nr:transcription elongation factor GreA [Caloranaerobacter azorensis]KGG79432.1 transcription elongation factor GreA [Caloranaerobacter azorensis H53214]QIB28079.1 transcription elongation factor GreA [Caloranaerobacter azorensis]SHH42210.1 transcription elongation factor GreA [Caloranaerobacter azorensis DSM 13643]